MFKYAVADRAERNRIARINHARGRSEGRSEAQTLIQAWWEEATKGGTQPPDLDNPPPFIDVGDDNDRGSDA